MNFLKRISHYLKPLPYDVQKQIAVKGSKDDRLTLAGSNNTTPAQANELLSHDAHEDVRLALSGRLVKLLPALSLDKQSQLYAFTVQALGTLALDEVLKVRRALSASLKDHAYAPPNVAATLAKDIEREVSEPILRFCVALSDEVLADIISTHPAEWAAEATKMFCATLLCAPKTFLNGMNHWQFIINYRKKWQRN